MNERIKQLYLQATGKDWAYDFDPHIAEKFAELIVRECMYVGRLAQINNQLVDSEIKEHFGVEE